MAVTTSTVVQQISDLLDTLYEDTLDSNTAFNLFSSLATSSPTFATGSSAAAQSQAAQQKALSLVTRVTALRILAKVVINHPYQDRQSAHDFRIRFMGIVQTLQQDLSNIGASELFNQVACISSTVGSEYARYTDSLRPIAYTTAATSALTLAWDLYQDPNQAADIIARNGAFGFLPDTVEYLTPA